MTQQMRDALDAASTAILFTGARTRNGWTDRPVPDALLREVYELARWAPTAANTNPARFVFIRSVEGKARLRPFLSPGNVDKTMTAPCCVIVARDRQFYELMPQLFPSRDMRTPFAGDPAAADEISRRSTVLQGAYLIVAARALGLDAGPMSGFDAAAVDAEFFPEGRWQSDFLCNLGYGSDENLFPRNPRLEFDDACRLA